MTCAKRMSILKTDCTSNSISQSSQRPWGQYFAALMRPFDWKLFHHMVCNILLICLKAPHADMSDSVRLLGNNDRFSPGKTHDYYQLSIKSPILVHVLVAKFSWGLKLLELNQLILFKVPFLLIIIIPVKKCYVPFWQIWLPSFFLYCV